MPRAPERVPHEIVLDQGVETVIVTLGSQGAVLRDGDGSVHVPAPRVNAIDTTAAGDAFNGALAAAVAGGKSYRDALAFAVAAGSLAVTRAGAQPSLPTLDDILATLG